MSHVLRFIFISPFHVKSGLGFSHSLPGFYEACPGFPVDHLLTQMALWRMRGAFMAAKIGTGRMNEGKKETALGKGKAIPDPFTTKGLTVSLKNQRCMGQVWLVKGMQRALD